MTVLIVVDKFPTFSETFIRSQIVALIDEGIDVYIYPKHGVINFAEMGALKGFENYQLEQRIIDLDAGYNTFKPVRFLMALYLLISHLFSSDFNYYQEALKGRRYGAIAKSLRLLFRVRNVLSYNIDIIHAHFGPNGERMAIMKKIGLPLKLFATFHGFDIRLGLKKGGVIYKDLFSYADGVIAISEYNRAHLLGFGLAENKLVSLPNGIAVASFDRETPNVLEGHIIKLLSVARLVSEKALHIAIKALAQVQKQLPEYFFEYSIIGDGPERATLETLASSLGVSEQVRFLGSQSSLAVQEAMKHHHLFLLSSEAEALPTVLLEAQAAGMVVLATDVGSVKNMVKGGFVVNRLSVEDFAYSLHKIIINNTLWHEISKKGIKHISANYDARNIIRNLINEYEL